MPTSIPLLEDAVLRQAVRGSSAAVARRLWPTLTAAVGRRGAARVLTSVAVAALRGQPFRDLGSPRDRRDALSRAQAAPVILLYRALRPKLGRQAAIAQTRALVIVGGVAFLSQLLGDIDAQKEAAHPELESRLVQRVARFFNAEGTVAIRDQPGSPRGTEVHYDVTSCRFVELCRAAGTPELTSLFCEVDGAYFDRPEAPLQLSRKKRLAAGDESCEFRFTWK